MDLFCHTDSPGNTVSIIHLELVAELMARPRGGGHLSVAMFILPVSVPTFNSGTDGLFIYLIGIPDTDSGYKGYANYLICTDVTFQY